MFSKRAPTSPPDSPTSNQPQEATDGIARNGDRTTLPPRYSNLTVIEAHRDSIAEERGAFYPESAEWGDGQSFVTLGSNISSPTYATSPHEGTRWFGESVTTFTSPPQYSLDAHPSQARGTGASQKEFVYRILRSGFKPQPWATLRLYETERAAARGFTGKHPRFSNLDRMLGNVELSLASPQTIKSINLVLKGTIITSASMDTGSLKFLDHTFTVWDRKSGDPKPPQQPSVPPRKFDGKLEGDIIFPFSIPFPSHVKLSTLSAVYPFEGEPQANQILPRVMEQGRHITPFQLDDTRPPEKGGPYGLRYEGQSRLRHISPFYVGGPLSPTPSFGESGLQLNTNFHQDHISPFQIDGSRGTSPTLSSSPSSPLTPFTYSQGETSASSSSPPSSAKARSRRASQGMRVEGSSQKTGRERKKIPPLVVDTVPLNPPYTATHRTSGPGSPYDPEAPVVLPLSFLEREVNANIQYELSLVISHGRFSTDSRVKTTVVYTPFTTPPPTPFIRHLTYQEGGLLPGPATDPDGWRQLSTATIRGLLYGKRVLDVGYTLYLANPLSYARGTVIPLYITLSCDDEDALNVLADPLSPRVVLRRSIRFVDPLRQGAISQDVTSAGLTAQGAWSTLNVMQLSPKRTSSAFDLTSQQRRRRTATRRDRSPSPQGAASVVEISPGTMDDDNVSLGSSNEDSELEIGTGAVWWVPQDSQSEGPAQRRGVRELQGEIILQKGLQPTCRFPLFNIRYRVELLAPASGVFEPEGYPELSSGQKGKGYMEPGKSSGRDNDGSLERVYASQVVEITTDLRDDEPVPTSFTGERMGAR